MSISDRILTGIKDMVLMRERIVQLADKVSIHSEQIQDHEARLIRIETLVEVAQGKSVRLPSPKKRK